MCDLLLCVKTKFKKKKQQVNSLVMEGMTPVTMATVHKKERTVQSLSYSYKKIKSGGEIILKEKTSFSRTISFILLNHIPGFPGLMGNFMCFGAMGCKKKKKKNPKNIVN